MKNKNETSTSQTTTTTTTTTHKPNIPIGLVDQSQESTEHQDHHIHPIKPISIESSSLSESNSVETLNSVEEDDTNGPKLPVNETDFKSSAIQEPPKVLSEFPLSGKAPLKPQPINILAKPISSHIRKKKPALSQTTFNHNNHALDSMEQFGPMKKYNENKIANAKVPTFAIPTCCNFSPDVNDGFTHHCRNRRMDGSKDNKSRSDRGTISYTPTWNVPQHFMTKDKGSTFS
jgi:hypothetical protein